MIIDTILKISFETPTEQSKRILDCYFEWHIGPHFNIEYDTTEKDYSKFIIETDSLQEYKKVVKIAKLVDFLYNIYLERNELKC